jgi:hypothetical protein
MVLSNRSKRLLYVQCHIRQWQDIISTDGTKCWSWASLNGAVGKEGVSCCAEVVIELLDDTDSICPAKNTEQTHP